VKRWLGMDRGESIDPNATLQTTSTILYSVRLRDREEWGRE